MLKNIGILQRDHLVNQKFSAVFKKLKKQMWLYQSRERQSKSNNNNIFYEWWMLTDQRQCYRVLFWEPSLE